MRNYEMCGKHMIRHIIYLLHHLTLSANSDGHIIAIISSFARWTLSPSNIEMHWGCAASRFVVGHIQQKTTTSSGANSLFKHRYQHQEVSPWLEWPQYGSWWQRKQSFTPECTPVAQALGSISHRANNGSSSKLFDSTSVSFRRSSAGVFILAAHCNLQFTQSSAARTCLYCVADCVYAPSYSCRAWGQLGKTCCNMFKIN